MIGLVFLATVINYLDRQTLSVVAPVITEQFHMSNVDYSRVVFAFMLAYTVMNGVSGPMVDRLGTRLGYAVCIAWWSIAAMLHSLARGRSASAYFVSCWAWARRATGRPASKWLPSGSRQRSARSRRVSSTAALPSGPFLRRRS